MTDERQPYVHIFVHRDVLTEARLAIRLLEDGQTLDDFTLRALKDLTDPLPEPDIYGYIPNVRHERLLPIA